MKPRVVILSAFLSPFRSGAEACAEEVALRLADRYDITIVTARLRRDSPKRDLLGGKVPVVRVGLGRGFDKWLYPFLAPFAARKLKPDVLHAVLETFAGLALHASRFVVPRAKQLLTLQTANRHFLRRHILRTPHAVTAISTALADKAAMLGRADAAVIPNGIDLAALENARRSRKKIPGRVLFVGRLEPMKGVDTLLRAFARLRGREELRVVGSGSRHFALEALARELGIADRVLFTGYVPADRIAAEYAEAEVFCGLSRSEAMGNVFLEAQAAGCAVVATSVGGIPEIVRDGVTGLLVPPDDVEAATSALERIAADPILRQTFSAAGVGNARSYGWDAIAPRYAQQYERLLTARS